ncbi:hypothetical protein [Luteimicrobium sp. DT211]|uniref:hypothetical protein n=1 Tax=Luteimicrobium sp. DT211 TaxID=3393412 RepID=UPI003CEEC9C9
MFSLRSLTRAGVVVAVSLGAAAGLVGPASAADSTVAKPTVTRPADQWVWSGQTAHYQVSAKSTGTTTYSWEYSADGGTKWQPLAGKTTAAITLKAATVRDGWKVRPKVTNAGGSTYGHSALLRVHSTTSDPFAVSPDASAGALTSGWFWTVVQTGHSSTAVSAYVYVHKVDATARVSDLRAAFRDASGAGTATTITKYAAIDSRTLILKFRATPSKAALQSATGDTWKLRDSVTGEYEYLATK